MSIRIRLFKVQVVARMYSVGAQVQLIFMFAVLHNFICVSSRLMTLRAQLMVLAAGSTAMVLLPLPQSTGQNREDRVDRTSLPRTF